MSQPTRNAAISANAPDFIVQVGSNARIHNFSKTLNSGHGNAMVTWESETKVYTVGIRAVHRR